MCIKNLNNVIVVKYLNVTIINNYLLQSHILNSKLKMLKCRSTNVIIDIRSILMTYILLLLLFPPYDNMNFFKVNVYKLHYFTLNKLK